MRRIFDISLWVLAVFLLSACGDSDRFRVEGTIEGAPTFNMRFHYYGDDALHTGITASREGKFMFSGSSREPVMVEIFDNDYHLLGRLYARNGDEIKCVLDPQNPYKSTFDGNDINRRWTKFTNANAEVLLRPGADANRLIAGYVDKNRSDIVSAMLLLGSFDAWSDIAMADTLLHRLAPEARPTNFTDNFEFLLSRVDSKAETAKLMPMTFADRNDSLRTFNPRNSRRTLVVISDSRSGRQDSIVPQLKKLRKSKSEKQLAIVDFSVDTDTLAWKQSIRRDSAQWLQGWAAGSLAAPAINRLRARAIPFFIVADSTGRQLYRGMSIRQAIKKLD